MNDKSKLPKSGRSEPIDSVPELVKRMYELVSEFESLFPNRPFTPDGHLVGSLGEVLASSAYQLELLPCSAECHDAATTDGRLVQIKATQGKSVALRAEPDHLLVISLQKDGTFEEVYNGPGSLVWASCGNMQKNGQRPIGTSKLRKLMDEVSVEQRIQRKL